MHKVIEKSVSSGNEIYYNEDPERLYIASNHNESFSYYQIFCYDEEVSVSKNKISDARLKKLDNVRDGELVYIKKQLILNR